MMLRRKSLRRLGILFLVLSVIGGATGLLAYRRHLQNKAHFVALRKEGMAAYDAGDFSRAVTPLELYVSEIPDDDPAVLAYAVARAHVETPGNQNLRQAVQKLDDLLRRHPDSIAAKHALLEIYPQTGNLDLLQKLSDDVLAADPNDEVALRGRIALLAWQQKLDEALKASLHYASLKPDDFLRHSTVLQYMWHLQKPKQEMLDYAKAQLDRNPEDPRFMLLMAYACNYAQQNEEAERYLEQASSRPIADAAFVRELSNLFDMLKQFDESQRILEQTAERTHDVEVLRILITRLWQNGRDEEILERLKNLDPASPRSDPELLALRAMALYQTQHLPEARAICAQLVNRKDKSVAQAWATALEARFEDYDKPPATVVEKLNRAIERDPDNGIFRSWIAESYWQLGEASLALRHWRQASLKMPSWSRPYVGMSQAMLQVGQTSNALQAAQAAYDRMPSVSAGINLAIIRYKLIEETADTQGARELLGLVEQLQKAIPGESRTLPIYVALLSRTGKRAEAGQLLEKAVADHAKLDGETLLRLAAVSRAEGFNLEQRLLEGLPAEVVTPRLALTRATLLAEEGKAADGLKLLESRAAAAPATQKLEWSMTLAQYLEATDNPAAAATWKKLGDGNEKSLDVQRTILAAGRSVRSDRNFVDRTINRLRDLTGPDGQQWKLERARWLIESPDVMRDGVDAAKMLAQIVAESPRQIEPRLQLARALEHTGNAASAIEHLRAAQSIDPRSASVTLELVRLLQQQGQTDQVREVLKRLSSTAMMTARQRVMLASLFADAGDNARAIELLSRDEAASTLLAPGRLLLAELYRRTGNTDKAAAIYVSALAATDVSPGMLASAAEFYATSGNLDQARQILARLDTTATASVDAAIAWGRFEERYGSKDSALQRYRAAAETGTEAGYLALIDYLLRQQDYGQAATIARQGQQKLPSSTVITNRLLEAQALVGKQKSPNNLQPLIEALSRDPSRAAEVETLRTLADFKSGRVSRDELTPKLRVIADRYPRFVPLQEQVVENYLQQQRYDDAIAVARRTKEALPTDPATARLAVRTFRAAHKWSEMRMAAEEWKQRLNSRTLDADTAIAEALLEMKKPDEALKQLEPHRALILEDVRTQPQAAVMLARAMLARNDGEAARAMLKPLLVDAAGRRMWLSLALGGAPDMTEAVAWIEEVISATPPENLVEERWSIATAWASIARKYGDRKLLENAADQLDAYVTAHPRDGDALFLQAGVNLELGRLDASESGFRAVLAAKPDHVDAANDLACLLTRRNRNLDEAEKLARLAVQKGPKSPNFHDTLARVLLARKQLDAAQAEFESALRLNPDLVESHVGLARVYNERGNPEQARRELQQVDSRLRANAAVAQETKEELASLRAALDPVQP